MRRDHTTSLSHLGAAGKISRKTPLGADTCWWRTEAIIIHLCMRHPRRWKLPSPPTTLPVGRSCSLWSSPPRYQLRQRCIRRGSQPSCPIIIPHRTQPPHRPRPRRSAKNTKGDKRVSAYHSDIRPVQQRLPEWRRGDPLRCHLAGSEIKTKGNVAWCQR